MHLTFFVIFFKTNKKTKTAKTTAWSFKNKLCIHLLYTVYAPCKNCAYNQKAVQLSHTCSVTFPKCVVDDFLCVRFQTDYSRLCFTSLTFTCENGFIRTAVRPDKLKLSTNSCCAANFLRIRWGYFPQLSCLTWITQQEIIHFGHFALWEISTEWFMAGNYLNWTSKTQHHTHSGLCILPMQLFWWIPKNKKVHQKHCMCKNSSSIRMLSNYKTFLNLTDKSCQFKYQYNNNLLCL